MHGCKAIIGNTLQALQAVPQADRYRNVGLFRYWTLSNAPLFLLATPLLLILISSSIWIRPLGDMSSQATRKETKTASVSADQGQMSPVGVETAQRLAVPQLVLAVLTLTTYHVQVVTRLSSGYPLWYWWLASSIVHKNSVGLPRSNTASRIIVGWMVMYALLQAGLFAAFLPPA